MRTLGFSPFAFGTGVATAALAACGALPQSQVTSSPSTALGINSKSNEQIFRYAGHKQSFTVPAAVTSVTITANGATGAYGGPQYTYAQSKGGRGATVTATIAVIPGEHLGIFVGGSGASGGFNGGGPGAGGYYAGGGGGASDVRKGGDGLSDRILVAGGGGGGGADAGNGSTDYTVGGNGGAGGVSDGASGLPGDYGRGLGGGGGTGGSQKTGGKGGAGGGGSGCGGSRGKLGSGGGAGLGDKGGCGATGGGGGAGYYGGGGGGAGGYDSSEDVGAGGGGGGGSSFAERQATRVKIANAVPGDSRQYFRIRPTVYHRQHYDGKIVITW